MAKEKLCTPRNTRFSETEDERLIKHAEDHHLSISQVVREAVRKHLGLNGKPKGRR